MTMIERVARTIRETVGDKIDGGEDILLARAVIKAMRKPTDEIVSEGCEPVWNYDALAGDSSVVLTSTVWRAMIDAILREGV